MKRPVAVVGVGRTRCAARRDDVSILGLVREAVDAALRDAGLEHDDIDAVVLGKAPDTFEGVLQPELMLADALGAAGKPALRVHTAGSVGGSTAVVGTTLVASGRFRRVLVVAFEKQSESNAMWALSPRYPFSPPALAGAGGYFAPIIRAYQERTGAPPDTGLLVACKDRANGARNPLAHVREVPTLDEARASPLLWDPVRYVETCPSSDGACAVILASDAGDAPAWVQGAAVRSEPVIFAGRDEITPAAAFACTRAVYAEAGITDPKRQIDVAELYVPFSWYEPMWLEACGLAEPGAGWRPVVEGVTAMGGALPVNPSGGVLCSNPIGASGLFRFAEAALQVRGRAGPAQVDGARTALGHAYGGGSQFFAMWVVGADRP
jgi:acetyl-CoA C-acetyltransferase